MRHALQTALALFVVIAANALAGPNRVAVQRDPRIQLRHRERIESLRPDVVLLGNSILREGIDEELLSRRTGRRCLEVARGGAASAWWYLALKNQVTAASHRVPWVVVVFRDHYLTEPAYRVDGRYRKAIDAMAGADEPLLDRLAYRGGIDPATWLLARSLPLYQRRGELREAVEGAIKDALVGRALGLARGGTDAAIGRVFATEALDPERLGAAQAEAEAVTGDDAYDFAARVSRSFLPAMLDLAEQGGTRLVFVRARRRSDADGAAEPPELTRYVAALDAWLAARGVPLLDFSRDPRLVAAHYADGDHLGPDGRALFTEMLAEALAPHLDAPRQRAGWRGVFGQPQAHAGFETSAWSERP